MELALLSRLAGFVYHMLSPNYYLLPGRLFECLLIRKPMCRFAKWRMLWADFMIMASTLETRWELLHQCLAGPGDCGPAAVDPAAEATPALGSQSRSRLPMRLPSPITRRQQQRDRARDHNKLVDAWTSVCFGQQQIHSFQAGLLDSWNKKSY